MAHNDIPRIAVGARAGEAILRALGLDARMVTSISLKITHGAVEVRVTKLLHEAEMERVCEVLQDYEAVPRGAPIPVHQLRARDPSEPVVPA